MYWINLVDHLILMSLYVNKYHVLKKYNEQFELVPKYFITVKVKNTNVFC